MNKTIRTKIASLGLAVLLLCGLFCIPEAAENEDLMGFKDFIFDKTIWTRNYNGTAKSMKDTNEAGCKIFRFIEFFKHKKHGIRSSFEKAV